MVIDSNGSGYRASWRLASWQWAGVSGSALEEKHTLERGSFSPRAYSEFTCPRRPADAQLQFGRHVAGRGWFATDYIAIDQGPILAMLENYRSEGVWSKLRQSSWLKKGLRTAGFRGGWIEATATSS